MHYYLPAHSITGNVKPQRSKVVGLDPDQPIGGLSALDLSIVEIELFQLCPKVLIGCRRNGNVQHRDAGSRDKTYRKTIAGCLRVGDANFLLLDCRSTSNLYAKLSLPEDSG
jgi:hypothetical protein